MRFLRGHAHFMLKQLFKKIVIVNDENMDPDAYNELSNTTYTNNEQWQKIADDFQFAYDNLPEIQMEKDVLPRLPLPLIWQRPTCIRLTVKTE